MGSCSPFGLKHKGYNNVVSAHGNSAAQKYKYNGKELNEELGLNMYDYGARFYDPAVGRWFTPDALAEKYYNQSPYTYTLNNPVYYIDPDGNQVAMCCGALKGFLATMVDNAVGSNLRNSFDDGSASFGNGVRSAHATSQVVSSALMVIGSGEIGGGAYGMATSTSLTVGSGGTLTPVTGPGFVASGLVTLDGIMKVAGGAFMSMNTTNNMAADGDRFNRSDNSSSDTSNSSSSSTRQRNKPKEEGVPNSSEIQSRSTDGKVEKYTTFDENGKIVKEYRGTGQDHGNIPRPNVKVPNYNVNPKTGAKFKNGYSVRRPTPDEIPPSSGN